MRPLLILLLLTLALPGRAAAQSGPLAPGASTGAAANVTQSTATLTGTVDPSGAETTYRFQYGTSTSYGLTTPTETVPAQTQSVSARAGLTGLTAGTTYHYRLVATNAAGTTPGSDRTFRTVAAPSRPAATTDPARDIAVDAVTLQGRVDANRQETSFASDYGTSTRYGATTAA